MIFYFYRFIAKYCDHKPLKMNTAVEQNSVKQIIKCREGYNIALLLCAKATPGFPDIGKKSSAALLL